MTDVQKIETTAVGFALAGFSGVLLWRQLEAVPVSHPLVYLCAGGVALGLLLITPDAIINTLKQLLVLYQAWRSRDPK